MKNLVSFFLLFILFLSTIAYTKRAPDRHCVMACQHLAVLTKPTNITTTNKKPRTQKPKTKTTKNNTNNHQAHRHSGEPVPSCIKASSWLAKPISESGPSITRSCKISSSYLSISCISRDLQTSIHPSFFLTGYLKPPPEV